ncbi:hypothetical protein B0H10DRAFT_371704 [Mycena sp. CBHHK59/15]|nr:hypothetical protein B0H10DRAFT_371704 [Mycena sp. CBHHK59/15]
MLLVCLHLLMFLPHVVVSPLSSLFPRPSCGLLPLHLGSDGLHFNARTSPIFTASTALPQFLFNLLLCATCGAPFSARHSQRTS